jgi:hypothetical protein
VVCFTALRLTARGQAGGTRGDSAHAHLDMEPADTVAVHPLANRHHEPPHP